MRPIIMRCELTSRLGRTRRARARSRGSETLLRIRSSAGYTIDTHESRFRKRQRNGAARGGALGRDWHEAPVFCDAPIRSLSDVKRTWRGRRERLDATRLTQLWHSTIDFGVVHNNVFTQKCGDVRPPA